MTTIDPDVTITAYGDPAPQGSKTRSRYGMFDDNARRLHPWRKVVTDAATVQHDGRAPLTGPLTVEITFTLHKPASAPKRRTTWPIARGKGDLDKLVRAACDSLTVAGVWTDDVLVVELVARKVYPGEGIDALGKPGAVIHVWQLPEGVEVAA